MERVEKRGMGGEEGWKWGGGEVMEESGEVDGRVMWTDLRNNGSIQ